ncbi:hypothetical protein BSKO_11166 [Bryopsis sp. KO-2023]|nr:hypothetical protein BSKO_11166 [Bryopsis sp. KO-2023]
MDAHDRDRIVCDVGAWMVRAGFASETVPSETFPDVVGKLRAVFERGKHRHFVGDEAYRMSAILRLDQPMRRSYFTDFEKAEMIWDHLFHEKLGVHPVDHTLLVTEPPLCPRSCREKLVQYLFETHSVPALFLANKSVLPLYARGLLTGVVLDSGEARSWAVPIYEGYAMPYAIQESEVAGAKLTELLQHLLRGLPCCIHESRKCVRMMKERLCYISQDFPVEAIHQETCFEERIVYTLPDGQLMDVGAERFVCPEVLFDPSIHGMKKTPGVHHLVTRAIEKSDVDLRNILADNIVVSGGSTLFPGFIERLKSELGMCGVRGVDQFSFHVEGRPERDMLTWLGGSALAQLPTFPDMCMTAKEYLDYGPSIVHRMSF